MPNIWIVSTHLEKKRKKQKQQLYLITKAHRHTSHPIYMWKMIFLIKECFIECVFHSISGSMQIYFITFFVLFVKNKNIYKINGASFAGAAISLKFIWWFNRHDVLCDRMIFEQELSHEMLCVNYYLFAR